MIQNEKISLNVKKCIPRLLKSWRLHLLPLPLLPLLLLLVLLQLLPLLQLDPLFQLESLLHFPLLSSLSLQLACHPLAMLLFPQSPALQTLLPPLSTLLVSETSAPNLFPLRERSGR